MLPIAKTLAKVWSKTLQAEHEWSSPLNPAHDVAAYKRLCESFQLQTTPPTSQRSPGPPVLKSTQN
eukprot:2478024-Amphidinium_carterae.1